jgi:ABC-2 type transport system ATP-binding protein
VLARYSGTGDDRIGPALERVGLADRARDKVSDYSLGIKQRLGLAAAFLKNRRLYLLDEPTNGLDPHGIAAMRGVIRELTNDGRTVLLSSHLLSEVEQVCDRIGIIHRGHLIREETTALLRGTGRLHVVAAPMEQAESIVGAMPGVDGVTRDGVALVVSTDPTQAAAINRQLVSAGIEVSEIREVARTLEETFIAVTTEAGQPAGLA